jgi:DNA-binding XRE family transcriptional regulator
MAPQRSSWSRVLYTPKSNTGWELYPDFEGRLAGVFGEIEAEYGTRAKAEGMKGRALVAWNLRRIRVLRGLSQERLAFDAGVDRSYVGGLERREENPTVDLLDRLAKTLSVPLVELFLEPAKGSSAPKPLKRGRRALN